MGWFDRGTKKCIKYFGGEIFRKVEMYKEEYR
jgi:hypothetical protein